jgi:hypothetical protein
MIVIVNADDDDHADDSEAVDEDQGEGADGDTVNGIGLRQRDRRVRRRQDPTTFFVTTVTSI